MPLLFKLNAQNNAVIHPEAVKLCPELKKLTKEEVLYIILTYDYHSPFKQFELSERKRLARNRVYKTLSKDPESKKVVQNGIDAYRSLQYDPIRETLESYRRKVTALRLQLDNAETLHVTKNITQTISLLNREIKEMETEVEENEQMAEIKGGGELSLIELFQKNRNTWLKQFKEVSDSKADAA